MNNILGSGMLPQFGEGIGYALQDEFTTNRAAGAVSGTNAEPGPGARTVIDTASFISINSGSLVFASGAINGNGFWLGPTGRAPGLALLSSYLSTAVNNVVYGFDTNTAINFGDASLNLSSVGIRYGSSIVIGVAPIAGTTYQIAITLRTTGAFVFIKGGIYTNWTLLWVSNLLSGATLYATLQLNGALTADVLTSYMRVVSLGWLPAPLASDGFASAFGTTDGLGHAEGIAGGVGGGGILSWAQQIGTWAVASGKANASVLSGGVAIATVNSGKADVLTTTRVTRSAGVAGVVVRYVDASNYIRAVHNGANAQLIKRVAGVDTVLVDVAATYVANAEIRVISYGTLHRLFCNNVAIGAEQTISDAALISPTLHGLYTSDISNQLDDFVCYARGTGNEYARLDNY